MVEHVRRHAVLIGALILAWLSHSALTAQADKPTEREHMPEVAASSMPLRAADEAMVPLRDPCKLEPRRRQLPPEPDPSSDPDPAALRRSNHPAAGPDGQDRTPDAAPPPAAGGTFDLWLDSVLLAGDLARARLSGQTVSLGARIPGLDPDQPPVLVGLDAVQADVLHRGLLYRLHLDTRPRITVRWGLDASPGADGSASQDPQPEDTDEAAPEAPEQGTSGEDPPADEEQAGPPAPTGSPGGPTEPAQEAEEDASW